MLEQFSEIRELLSLSGDYIYISTLKYILTIIQYYTIALPALALWAIVFYVLYKKVSFQRINGDGVLLVALTSPVSIFIYAFRFFYVFFERFIYYKLWGIDYFQDVPRRKRDYILEQSIREQILRKQGKFGKIK